MESLGDVLMGPSDNTSQHLQPQLQNPGASGRPRGDRGSSDRPALADAGAVPYVVAGKHVSAGAADNRDGRSSGGDSDDGDALGDDPGDAEDNTGAGPSVPAAAAAPKIAKETSRGYLRWDGNVNSEFSETTYTDCLKQARKETNLTEEREWDKDTVEKLLPVLQRLVTKAKGDITLVDYDRLIDKLRRKRRQQQVSGANGGGCPVEGTRGAKRTLPTAAAAAAIDDRGKGAGPSGLPPATPPPVDPEETAADAGGLRAERTAATTEAPMKKPRRQREPQLARGGGLGAAGGELRYTAVAHPLENGRLSNESLLGVATFIAPIDPRFHEQLGIAVNSEAREAETAAREEAEKLQVATRQLDQARDAVMSSITESADGLGRSIVADRSKLVADGKKASAAAAMMAEATDRAINLRAIANGFNGRTLQAYGRLKERLGGDGVIARLPDLLSWAVGFVARLPTEQRRAAAEAAARNDIPGEEYMQHLEILAAHLLGPDLDGNALACSLIREIWIVKQIVQRIRSAAQP